MAKSWYLPWSPLLSVYEGVWAKKKNIVVFFKKISPSLQCLFFCLDCFAHDTSKNALGLQFLFTDFLHCVPLLFILLLLLALIAASVCTCMRQDTFKQFPRDWGVKRWNYFCSWQNCVYGLRIELREERNHNEKRALGKVLPKDLQSCRGIIHLLLSCLPAVLFPSIFQVLPAGQGSWFFPSAQHQSFGSSSAREM